MMPQEEKKHKRRVHYSGKYPKKFEEKYKEHQPEKYQDMIEHVIRKGNTPAGMHQTQSAPAESAENPEFPVP